MSDEAAISVQNLSKSYKLYDSPQDRLKESLHPLRKKYHRDFYALDDVSFEVKKGETVAIIGRNGSGKSTLLKTITGVLTPSSGSVTVSGKISALLELGAGFNPQLTGMENVFFNGTIMGYSREQMNGKLDDILAFADIGAFIDQPVKTYSSGMFVRLAFAVAVNIDPEILIIDEALAVGDARFRKKCYDRFRLFRESGKTILLVTHDTEAVKTYARQAIFLEQGSLVYHGEPKEAVKLYLRMLFPVQHKIDHPGTATAAAVQATPPEGTTSGNGQYLLQFTELAGQQEEGAVARLVAVSISGLQEPNIFHGGETLKIVVEADWDKDRIAELALQEDLDSNLIFGFRIQNQKGMTVLSTNSALHDLLIDPLEREGCTVTLDIEVPRLCKDHYFITPTISLGTQEHHTGLVTNENLVHLTCVPEREIYGFVDSFSRIEIAA